MQAVGIAKSSNGGLTLTTKKAKHAQRPGVQAHNQTFAPTKSTRK